jgi:hypothetical protein
MWRVATCRIRPQRQKGLRASRSNGPFDHPESWDKYKLFNKLTLALTPSSSLSVGEMSYGANWHGSGQIPARAVDQGCDVPTQPHRSARLGPKKYQ